MLTHAHAEPKSPSRVVVIGAGFVGNSIARAVERRGVPVLALKRADLDLLADNAAESLAKRLRADDSVVFVSAQAPARNAAQLIQNLKMAEVVAKTLAAQSVAHLVYISSDAVYADDANPVTERSSVQPASMHGMMHAARELMLRTEAKVPLAILRPSLLYGAADPHNGYGPNRFRRLAAKGETITLFGEGEEMRDHVLIDDVAEIAAATLAHRSTGVLNIATGVSTSFRRIAEMIVARAGRPVEIKGTPRQNPITHRHFDIADTLKAFPAFHFTPLAKGLELAETGA
ncbi:MAG TPA: NAD(P)-dependent oxidoreductase [Alphaproteobacteria bacterium]|nr:NAD(P)-dependent oxidoreductase [Alphaproteobacteria bacterium]